MSVSVRAEVLLWAQRVLHKCPDDPHALLEVKPGASFDQVQSAFHEIARVAHPDLHRTTLTDEELELVTTAYSRVAAAYQDLRANRMQTTRIKPIDATSAARKTTGSMRPIERPMSSTIKPANASTTPAEPTAVRGALEMTSKALVHYRKAELELRRGDLKMALLQLKLAVAADPQSAFLRSALAEVQNELAKP